ncbi:HAD family hydrolase [Gordonia humi]|uniref:Phosphoglycolate phosphatase/pyrophosphatase PpaX n=1 Tax=Gordonia humi TaxID=686429 RepID=A0A840EUL4_9ACTN|nr:HAD family hydrolase [Gordonia humi]MBB4134058.1 phosphoglycolate phosphatase/pyrophosphatase PpaX [Gordonia humi]
MVETEGVLFDLDGTLIDSRQAIIEAYRQTFEQDIGRPLPAPLEDASNLMAPRPPELFAEWAPGDGDPLELERAYGAHYESGAYRFCVVYPGLHQMLAALNDRGIVVGIVTNKRRSRVEADFDFLGLAESDFATVVTADDSVERKPHPRPIEIGLERAGLDPVSSWYVGDGPHDVEAGSAAGTRTIGAGYGYYGAERLSAASPTTIARSLADIVTAV